MSESISDFDIEELVRGMANLSDEDCVIDYVDEHFYTSWDDFCRIIRELMPLVIVGQSPLTKKIYRGFGKDGMFFIKRVVSDE